MSDAMIGILVFAFFAMIAGALFHRIIGAYIEGAIGGLQCIIMSGLFIGLMVCAVTAPKVPGMGLIALIIVMVFIAVPIITSQAEKKETREFYDEKMERYRAAIRVDPRNLAARSKLVDMLQIRGLLEEAVQECETLLSLQPDDRQVEYRLRLLKEDRDEKAGPAKMCPGCGHRNPRGRTRCEKCEGVLVTNELKRWLLEGGFKKVTWSSAFCAGLIALVTTILTILAVPAKIALIALTLLLIISVQYLYIVRHW